MGAGEPLRDWRVFPLPLDNLDRVEFSDSKEEPTTSGPTFYRCAFRARLSLLMRA